MLKQKLEKIAKLLPDNSSIEYKNDVLIIKVGESEYWFKIVDEARLDRIEETIRKNRENYKKKLDKSN